MNQTEYKRLAAAAALEFVEPGSVLGIGTGSTVNIFLDLLADRHLRLEGAVSSSEASTRKLQELEIPVLDLNHVDSLDLYVDGTDEFDPHRRLVKGGGAALTREKIVAAASRKFICIADESKAVRILGAFPLPVEVIPMARSLVARKLVGLGGRPEWRQACVTDNGNHILDVRGLDLTDPVRMERAINDLPGVVTCGLFALRPADLVLCAGPNGLRRI